MNTPHNLIITEKPSVARQISAVLNVNERKDGFFIGNSYIVSWCAEHLLELAAPDAYGEQYAFAPPLVRESWDIIKEAPKNKFH